MKTKYTVEPDPQDYEIIRIIQTTTMSRVEFEAIHGPLILTPKVLPIEKGETLQLDDEFVK